MSKVNIYLVRHGETIFNAKGIIQGAADAPLTQEGIQQAITLGEKISEQDFGAVYSSDLRRAYETANYIIQENKNPVTVEPMKAFREFDFGLYEGDSSHDFWDTMAQKYNFDLEHIMKTDFMKRYDYVYDEVQNPIGEKNENFKKRIYEGMVSVSKQALSDDVDNIMIVAHGVTILGIIHLLIDNYKFTSFISNAGVTKFTFDGNQFENIYISKVF